MNIEALNIIFENGEVITLNKEECSNFYISNVKDNGEEITKEIKHSLVPIIKCFNGSNEEILADIIVTLVEVTQPTEGKKYTVSNIPSCISYLMIR